MNVSFSYHDEAYDDDDVELTAGQNSSKSSYLNEYLALTYFGETET